MTDQISRSDASELHAEHQRELTKEAATMALYVAICLLAALGVASYTDVERPSTVIKVVWGTTVGLALAHWFAFRLSSRFVAAGVVRQSDTQLAMAQLAGGVVVAVLATIPVLVFPADVVIEATCWVLVAFVALVAYVVARSSGASAVRSVLYACTTTVIGLAIVVVKNVLSGH